MEHMEAFHDGEWEFLSRMFAQDQEFDHSAVSEFLGLCSFPSENDHGILKPTDQSSFSTSVGANTNVSGVNAAMFSCMDNLSSSLLSAPHSYDSVFTSNVPTQACYLHSNNPIPVNMAVSSSIDICMGIAGVDEKHINASNSFVPMLPDIAMGKTAGLCEGMNDGRFLAPTAETSLKRKFDLPGMQTEHTKKRLRLSRHAEASCGKSPWSKKMQKLTRNGSSEDIISAGSEAQSSSSYGSDDENASQDTNNGGPALMQQDIPSGNLNAKMRASRGTATDPQSLYARKRRERINERLKILQRLVPNGTKVDISTMLEEAVHYVKFLQLQIKLLSSDDLWMYAPLAYNGIDMGLHHKLFSQLLPQ